MHKTVVVCLPRPMEGMGRLQFSDLFTELPVPPQATGVVGTLNCVFHHSEHYSLFFNLKDAILFYKVFFLYISINVILGMYAMILLMTDGLNYI